MRLTRFQAALGRLQLKRVAQVNAHRRKLTAFYRAALGERQDAMWQHYLQRLKEAGASRDPA